METEIGHQVLYDVEGNRCYNQSEIIFETLQSNAERSRLNAVTLVAGDGSSYRSHRAGF